MLTVDLLYSLHGERLCIVNGDGSGLSAVQGIEIAIDAAGGRRGAVLTAGALRAEGPPWARA